MIPRILHRIWIGGPMPEPFVEFGRQWQKIQPDWIFMEWTDPQSFPQLQNQDLFDNAPSITFDWKRFQADLLRLELLYLIGGVYVDTDVQPLKPLDRLLHQTGCFLGWSPNKGPGGKILATNTVIGAVVEHPFIKVCIDTIPESVDEHQGKPVAQMVGPWHITRALDRTPLLDQPVIYPSNYFYPQSIEARDANKPLNLSNSYTHHFWNTSAVKRGIGIE